MLHSRVSNFAAFALRASAFLIRSDEIFKPEVSPKLYWLNFVACRVVAFLDSGLMVVRQEDNDVEIAKLKMELRAMIWRRKFS